MAFVNSYSIIGYSQLRGYHFQPWTFTISKKLIQLGNKRHVRLPLPKPENHGGFSRAGCPHSHAYSKYPFETNSATRDLDASLLHMTYHIITLNTNAPTTITATVTYPTLTRVVLALDNTQLPEIFTFDCVSFFNLA
jgi:hypothetical protein